MTLDPARYFDDGPKASSGDGQRLELAPPRSTLPVNSSKRYARLLRRLSLRGRGLRLGGSPQELSTCSQTQSSSGG